MEKYLAVCPFCHSTDVSVENFGSQHKPDWRFLCHNKNCLAMVQFFKEKKLPHTTTEVGLPKKEAISRWNIR